MMGLGGSPNLSYTTVLDLHSMMQTRANSSLSSVRDCVRWSRTRRTISQSMAYTRERCRSCGRSEIDSEVG